jgi:leader peptidase (prepilin peptidase)/N-methyltransferase
LLFSAAVFVFLAFSIPIVIIDLREKRIPDRILIFAYPLVAALLLLAAWQGNNWDDLLRAVLSAVAVFAGYFVLRLINPGGLGAGDVKLSGLIGLILGWVGWQAALVGTAIGFVLGALVAILLLVIRGGGLKQSIAFGPYMIAGAWLVLVPALIVSWG